MICLVLLSVIAPTVVAQRVSPIKINAGNAVMFRDSLNKLIFGPVGFPYSVLPDSYVSNVSSIDHYAGSPYSSIMYPAGNLDSIDKMEITVDTNSINFPSKVKTYLFHSHNSNGKLFIYHAGHCVGAATAEDVIVNGLGSEPGLVIAKMIKEGYTVLVVPMFNYRNPNNDGYSCGFNNHDNMFLDNNYEYPMGLFFKPLAASLNFLGRGNYNSIYMCGFSGGGWATSVYPALDSSVSISVIVSGSWPMPIRQVFFTDGDYEQLYPPVFVYFLDYHELYTLGCLAPARKMLQINNRLDPCCYNSPSAHIFYVDSVQKALAGSGGDFKFYLDETDNRHAITARDVKVMFKYINGEYATLNNLPADTVNGTDTYSYFIPANFVVNTTPSLAPLSYSLLKAPSWLQLNGVTGELYGTVPPAPLLPIWDTISFKAEDTSGRFVIYDYVLNRKREKPFFFTMYNDSTVVYFQPFFTGGMAGISNSSIAYFYFNDPQLLLLDLKVQNNSLIRMKFNRPLADTDSIGYNGLGQTGAVLYNNGRAMENFGLSPININRVSATHARMGMIRFNTDTRKFEYFNGNAWINMH